MNFKFVRVSPVPQVLSYVTEIDNATYILCSMTPHPTTRSSGEMSLLRIPDRVYKPMPAR